MAFRWVLYVAFTVLGVSAKSVLDTGFQSNGYNFLSGGYGSTLPVINTHVRTPVVQNPPVQLPAFPSTVADTYHCFKNMVRPQICNEIISVPTVDRLVRTVSTPEIVGTLHFSTNDVNRYTQTPGNVLSGSDGRLTAAYQTNNVGSYKPANIYNGANTGTFSTYQTTNGNVFNKPTFTTYSRTNTGALNSRPATATLTATSATFQNPAIYQNNYPNTVTY